MQSNRPLSTDEVLWWLVGILAVGAALTQAGRAYRVAITWACEHDVLVDHHVAWALPSADGRGLDLPRVLIAAGAVVVLAAGGSLLRRSARSRQSEASPH